MPTRVSVLPISYVTDIPYLLDYTPPSNKRPPPLRGLSYCAGFFSDNTNQHLLYCEDITSLKSSGCDLDFLWRDIQLSKGKTNGPRPVKLMVGRESNNVELQYRMAPCAGVKQCPTSDCHYTVAIRENTTSAQIMEKNWKRKVIAQFTSFI